ncbi:uncharacterized protein LOC120264644 [Dioscorea cayenensis subsp. rotundata]|uniref:Uncharacterized protein LOC120264644 n=1 Tax=Dioscorea cayennensis subsp. rotundata TaxID=55577 RepID=A0AB40BM93_DIOCR|nr:uncharacterized protein LOC120264644 [Dioscorea cayenensis subsp. rotundata]
MVGRGWNLIWKLLVPPRVKIFVWKLAHGKLPTGNYLYNINIGPDTSCTLCGLFPETADHLLWHCRWAISCWDTIFTWLGLDHSFHILLCNGSWLTCNFLCAFSCDFARALIALVAWHIWTVRCHKIFRHSLPNFSQIPSKAWASAHDYFSVHGFLCRNLTRGLIPFHPALWVFSDAAWDPLTGKAGFGFIITTNRNIILLAGAAGDTCASSIDAELHAIHLALTHCCSNNWSPSKLYSDCRCALDLIDNFNNVTAWRSADIIHSIKRFTYQWPDLTWEHVPRDFNCVADSLAHFGSLNPQISLFAQGRDRPRWLDDLCSSSNFSF